MRQIARNLCGVALLHRRWDIQTTNHTAWQSARTRAGLPDLHVHDLRHTSEMLRREAGVPSMTIRDILWHSGSTITDHYTLGRIQELHAALEKIVKPSGGSNKSIQSLRAEAAAARRQKAGAAGPTST
jgi:integrase